MRGATELQGCGSQAFAQGFVYLDAQCRCCHVCVRIPVPLTPTCSLRQTQGGNGIERLKYYTGCTFFTLRLTPNKISKKRYNLSRSGRCRIRLTHPHATASQ